MSLEKWTTLQTEQIQTLSETLSERELSAVRQLEPIADFEELFTFDEAYPTPTEFTPEYPAWRLESVAARVIEAVAIAAHEPLTALGYRELARILSAHAEYLYTYSDGEPRPRLEAGSALALAGSVCASLPQSALWRLAGFGRMSGVLTEVAPTPTDSHLIRPIDVAFSLANERNLPILAAAVNAYNTVLKRNFTPQRQYNLPLSDSDFFEALNLDFCESKLAVKNADDVAVAKAAYTVFRREFLDSQVEQKSIPLTDRSDTYTTAKTYLECLLRLSIHPTPAITATTEIGIAAHLFPEFRGSEQLRLLALRRYKWIMEAFFHSDGFHKDRTLRSHVEAIADSVRFLSVYGDARESAGSLAEIQTSLERQVEACIRLRQPDNAFPPFGPLPAPNFDAAELCTIVDKDFRLEDFPSTDTTSHALPETGCYVMRDSWEPEAQYLFFDTHPSEKPSHTDTSIFVLHAHGRHLTTGSVGVLETTRSEPDALNTRWITTPAFDFVEKWDVLTAALGNAQAVPKTTEAQHKRAIFYLKGEYFVLHDLVLGAGAYTLEQVFRFDRKVAPYIISEAGNIRTQEPQRSNLFIGAVQTPDLSVTSGGNSITYRKHRESPMAVNTVLLPMKPEVEVRPTLSAIEVFTDPDVLGTGFTLRLPNATDTFLISDDGLAEMSTADIRCVGEFLFLRRDTSGAAVQFVMLNARFLQVDGSVLADLDETCESYVRM
ncbi:hypothetical protein F4X88_20600 [Candidatus Poribacteria bacterium]|nr:hypothetical protein [Candidatus Poribacteria bacterium]MYA58681.1 hypothetical protein [Candidatus Poribacteria bacterium]